MKTIDEQIKKYLELNAQKEALEKEMSDIKSVITAELVKETLEGATYTTEDNTASVTKSVKENVKYTDETAMISILESKGLNQFVTKKVVTTALNKELKKGGVITEALKGLYTSSISESLTIKSK
jgi:uncharacterized NAD-dependent epimerase/dehydratase family protein